MAEAPRGTIRPMTPEELRQAEQAEMNRIIAEVEARKATETEAGGRYLVGDQLVDANGEPFKKKKAD